MFKKEMSEKLQKIFGLKKVTFDQPSESFEQDVLFIQVAEARSNAGKGTVSAKVTGVITIFAQNNELPYGFFNKKISQALPELTDKFFFFDMDSEVLNSPARLQNISERKCNFVYLYKAQYDPKQGSLTSLTVELGGS